MTSSRSQLIHSATITLLLFGQCCWSLWIRTPENSHTFNENLLVANEYANGNGVEPPLSPQHIPSRSLQNEAFSAVVPDPMQEQEQIRRFLDGHVVAQKLHSVTSNLRHLLKQNIDGDLPIVYNVNGGGGMEPWEDDDGFVGRRQGEADEDEDDLQSHPDQTEEDTNEVSNDQDPVDVVEYEINEQGEVELKKDKRSGRYYRRYPFKRRNNRYYEQPKHNCKPSREEVVKLLIALHKYQEGKTARKMVRFCKRDRPLGNIITNIRFLG